MTRPILFVLFAAILLSMLAVTTYASLDRSVFAVGPQLMSDPWFHATLADAYFGFLTFFVWVAYKEAGIWRKLLWFVLIMLLGNIAMSIYMLIQIVKMAPEDGIGELLTTRRSSHVSSRKS